MLTDRIKQKSRLSILEGLKQKMPPLSPAQDSAMVEAPLPEEIMPEEMESPLRRKKKGKPVLPE